MTDLRKVGIHDPSFEFLTVAQMVTRGLIERPLDGNHGEIHPKGEDFVPTGVPFIMASDIYDGVVDYVGCKFITERQANSLRKGFAKNGDILLTHKATIGRTAIVRYDKHPFVMLTPQVTYYRVEDSKRLNNLYLRNYFDSPFFQETMNSWAGAGATRAYLGITDQAKLPVVLPPKEKQEKIAAILSAYDDLIENNRRRIALLEKMAEEIYREWFVRLRFPGHEQAKFEKGLPVGWRESASSDVFEVLSGGTPKTDVASYWNGDIPFFTPRDATESFYVLNTEKNITANGLRTCNSRLYSKDTIFITARGTVGKLALASRDMAMNQSCYALVPKGGGPVYFHYLAIQNAITYLKGISKSGVFDNVVVDTFKTVPIVMPTDALIQECNQVLEPLFVRVVTLLRANEVLVAQRDALLPRLISGKLAVDALDIRFPDSMQLE